MKTSKIVKSVKQTQKEQQRHKTGQNVNVKKVEKMCKYLEKRVQLIGENRHLASPTIP